jgi:protein-S-isoprenylcysteine O-methyltransferase Ste14
MILDYIGILVMAVLSGARLKQLLMGEWWAVPLFTHAMLSAFLLVIHRKASRQSPLLQRLVAWSSALLPFAIQINQDIPLFVRILSLAGVGIAIWTLLVLGKSFDVTPADRGLVNKGPYKFVRHPMYSSELFSVIVMVLIDLSLRNILVTMALAASLILRIYWEEKIIKGYPDYSLQVRSRLLPGVW